MKFDQLENILGDYPSYRLVQAREAVFKRLASSWEEVTNIPKGMRALLERVCPLEINAGMKESADGKTVKAVVTLDDGECVETVLMRHNDGRNTVCVSSQVGCGMGCVFCATGLRGFSRNCTAEEIVTQIVLFGRYLKPGGEEVRNVVFMGMGEPFFNYDEVMKAVRIMNDAQGLNIGARHISISTAGVVEGIRRFAEENLQVNLAISVNAPDEKLRRRLMPGADGCTLREVLQAAARYIARTRRRLMIEYVMLKGVNDSEEQARALARLLRNELRNLFFVNLIRYNPVVGYQSSDPGSIARFKRILTRKGITVTERYRFGGEIDGACGQLAGKQKGKGEVKQSFQNSLNREWCKKGKRGKGEKGKERKKYSE